MTKSAAQRKAERILAELSPKEKKVLKLWYSGAKIPEISGETGFYSAKIYDIARKYEEAISD